MKMAGGALTHELSIYYTEENNLRPGEPSDILEARGLRLIDPFLLFCCFETTRELFREFVRAGSPAESLEESKFWLCLN